MIELTILALLHRLTSWGREPVIATRPVAADAATLRALLADPGIQARLAAAVSPLLRARAHLSARSTPRLVSVALRRGGREVLWLTWILAPRRGTTDVDLAAQLESGGVLPRVALALGGRRWLRGRLERALDVLADLAHRAVEDCDLAPATSARGRRGRTAAAATAQRPAAPR